MSIYSDDDSDWQSCRDYDRDDYDDIGEYTSCKHAYGVPAYKSYGSNIPDNCQGCVFPGDEAHVACDIDKSRCEPDYCPFGPGFWHRRSCDSSIQEAANALFGKAS